MARTPIRIRGGLQISAGAEALGKWSKLEDTKAWILESVLEYNIIELGAQCKRTVHFGCVHPQWHVKHSELPKDQWTYN